MIYVVEKLEILIQGGSILTTCLQLLWEGEIVFFRIVPIENSAILLDKIKEKW
jgi:hypothetical protein